MIYTKKEKNSMRDSLRSLLSNSDNIKAITKTRFINELEKIKEEENADYMKNVLNYVFSDLEGKNVSELKENIIRNSANALMFINKSEKKMFNNILKKVRNRHVLVGDETKVLYPYLLGLAEEEKKTQISLLKDDINLEHVDLALIPIEKIDYKGNMSTNKNYLLLLVEAKNHNIPVCGYVSSLNVVEILDTSDKNILKPNLISSLISDVGVFEPEMFVEELKIKRPWLFS